MHFVAIGIVYLLMAFPCRYLDKIILDILYKSAQAVAEKETDQQLQGLDKTSSQGGGRRDSAPPDTSSQLSSVPPRVNLEIKQRIKALQKSHLMQAHDALMTVLEEIKDTVEVLYHDK